MTLDAIGYQHKTDKASWHHNTLKDYEKHFEGFRQSPIVLLELGVGGYHFPDRGGESLKTWRDYFPAGKIYGIDIHLKTGLNSKRIKTFTGSQDNAAFLKNVVDEIGAPDVIIDDASHINPLTLKTFEILFPMLKPGGLYCIEDLETSWYEEHGFEGCADLSNFQAPTAINLLRVLLNAVNAKFLPAGDYLPVESVHVYQNLAIIHKKP